MSMCMFCEFFSGDGPLSEAVRALGVPVREPDDLKHGGTDFSDAAAVAELRRELGELAASGVKLVVHLAPPCSTFSRARNRHPKTKLRTREFPQGLPRKMHLCKEANYIARNALDFAESLARDVGAVVTMENPESSWLWDYLETDANIDYHDVCFSTCLFGAPYQKHTRNRVPLGRRG